MNRNGQLGQIITSFPVLLLLLVIMILFFVVAGMISAFGGSEESVSDYGVEEINSRVLLEMFLGDYVIIGGKKEKIEKVILNLVEFDEEKRETLSKLLQEKFHEKYGCDKNNQLQIYNVIERGTIANQAMAGVKFSYVFYIDYPETLEFWNKEIIEFIWPSQSFDKLFVKGFAEKRFSEKVVWKIVTKGNVKC